MSYSYYITPDEYTIAERNGINAENLERRVRMYGWDNQRAITEPIRRRRGLVALSKIASNNGIPYSVMKHRIYRGWDPVRATTEPLTNKSERMYEQHERNRKYPKLYLERALSNGISVEAFRWRMRNGWTLERASETKPLDRFEIAKIASSESWWKKGPQIIARRKTNV